jgi:nucleotide-binding universal stress UspA family protein
MAWNTIVVGYDRTHASNKALLRAAELAEESKASLIVTSVARLLPSGAAARGIGPFDPADDPQRHREELAHAKEMLATKKIKPECVLEAGNDPAHVIVELARRRKADLIVVGHHEDGFFSHVVHSSVDTHVAREAVCDVLVVH